MALPPITYRLTKGDRLTNLEVDNNFLNLDTRAAALEAATESNVATVAGLSPVAGDIEATALKGALDVPSQPSDIGAATAAQGDLADTAIQPDALALALDDKVDKVPGKGLSEEDFTTTLRTKLVDIEEPSFRGTFPTFAALVAGVPDPVAGNYADEDAGPGSVVIRWIWDVSDDEWVTGSGGGGPSSTDSLPEGLSNLYFTTARVLAATLTGLSLIAGGAIISTDSVLIAFGKIQNQITALTSTVSYHIGSRGEDAHLVASVSEAGFMPPMPPNDGKTYAFKNGSLEEIQEVSQSVEVVEISAGVLNLSTIQSNLILVDLNQNITSIILPDGEVDRNLELLIQFTQSGDSNWTISGWPTSGLVINTRVAPPASKGVGASTQYILTNFDNEIWVMHVDLNPAFPLLRVGAGQRIVIGAVGCTALGTLAMVIGRVQYIPFTVPRPMTISALGISVSTVVTVSTATVGIYDSDGSETSDKPGKLLASSAEGALITTTTGTKLGSMDISLIPGHLYFAALVCDKAVTVRAVAIAAIQTCLGFTDNSTTGVTMFVHTGTRNQLPAQASEVSTVITAIPAIYLVEALA